MRNLSLIIAICSVIGGSLLFTAADAKKVPAKAIDGRLVFQQHCASCHAGGGNRVKPGKPVAESKVLVSALSFKSYLSSPPGHMPYYQQIVKDPKTLNALYDYCKSLKRQPIKQALAPDVGVVAQ